MHIPFKSGHEHDVDRWQYGDSIIVRVCNDEGVFGYGECKPKKNITGETIESVTDYIANVFWPSIQGQILPIDDSLGLGYKVFESIHNILPEFSVPGVLAWNSARAAVELAIIDCFLRGKRRSLIDYIPPKAQEIEYSATITARQPEKIASMAKEYYSNGRRRFRLKISHDYANQVEAFYSEIKEKVSLHLDANGHFDLELAAQFCNEISHKYNVEAIEDPIPRGDVSNLRKLSQEVSMPLMLDDWIVTHKDADSLIENLEGGIFYLKVSKCGGLVNTLSLAERALNSGFQVGIGSHVAETGILSAVGRNIAAHIGDCKYVSGSSGSRLVENVVEKPVCLSKKGFGSPLKGLGIGVPVSDANLEKFSSRKLCLGKSI